MARNASTHAAGVVICREPLTELMPLQKATNSDALMTQYEMHGVEALGLLKFDFLGPVEPDDPAPGRRPRPGDTAASRSTSSTIPLDDATTFELLASGETTGVFQLESAGMRRYIRELQPTSVYDLAAMVALFRPGPMDNIPAYIRRKHGQEPVTYLHPLLEPYLEKTYGIFVYQEDIMAAAIALGGFTGPEADTLGYAIRKKKSRVLRAQTREVRHARPPSAASRPQVIDAVFTAFEPFERYGFNKAHATCYGLIAYQTAYLKANYTVEYMAARADRVPGQRGEGRGRGRRVPADGHRGPAAGRPPQPARVHRRGRRDPVRAAGGQERRRGRDRIDHRGPRARAATSARSPTSARGSTCAWRNRKVLESLAKVGALNAFGHPAQVLAGLDDAIAAAQAAQRDRDHRPDLAVRRRRRRGAGPRAAAAGRAEAPVRERLRWEKELLGLYLSDHPLGEVADEIGRYVTAYSGDLRDESLDQQRVVVGGIVTGLPDDHDEAPADDGRGDAGGPAGHARGHRLPAAVRADAATWAEGAILLVAGRVDHKGEEVPLLADLVTEWETATARGPEAFARDVAAGDRSRGRGRQAWAGGNRHGHGRTARNGQNGHAQPADGSGPDPALEPACRRPTADRYPAVARPWAPMARALPARPSSSRRCARGPPPVASDAVAAPAPSAVGR